MSARIKTEVIDELLANCGSPGELLAENGLFKQLKKQLLERLLNAELRHHLGYEKGAPAGRGSDDRIISLYARGMSVREIQGRLHEMYGVEVSADLISRATEVVLEELREWQSRPLERVYPVVFLDALRVKVRDEGLVRNKAIYVALGITPAGEKEVLGLWVEQTEGAKLALGLDPRVLAEDVE